MIPLGREWKLRRRLDGIQRPIGYGSILALR
jgi:hypothetical protein